MQSVFTCVACPQTFRSKPDLRTHLINRHNFQVFRSFRATENLQRNKIVNPKYKNPGNLEPPVVGNKHVEEPEAEPVQDEVQVHEIEEVHEEVGEEDIIQIGEVIPRDVELEMVERNGEFVFIRKNNVNFQGP